MLEVNILRNLKFVLLMLFLPFVLNTLISWAIGFYAARLILARGGSPEEIGLEITRFLFTYNFYWSIIQVSFGLYLAKLMGGKRWLKDQYDFKDLSIKYLNNIALIVLLILISEVLIWGEQAVMSSFYGGWKRYMEYWKEIVKSIPFYSKLYLVCIAPFTAGIFEEIIWRGYGISQLEPYLGLRKAVIIQAIAFGIWHGISFHAVITFLIGLIYGYVYIKRRRLLTLSLAHIITDVIGFYFAFMK